VLPAACLRLWRAYLDLATTRGWADGGPLGITYGEISAYAKLMDCHFEPWEVMALREVDKTFFVVRAQT
jgi:hypothetical protein